MSIELCYNRNCNKQNCTKLHALSCSKQSCSKFICNHAHINHNPTFCKYGMKCTNNNCYNAHHPLTPGTIIVKHNNKYKHKHKHKHINNNHNNANTNANEHQINKQYTNSRHNNKVQNIYYTNNYIYINN